MSDGSLIDTNLALLQREATKALRITRSDRHSSVEPYEWYGPSPEPNTSGENCPCSGCEARLRRRDNA